MDPLRAATLDHLAALVAFDTTSSNSNLAIVDHIEGVLKPLGARLERVYDAGGGKANLYASFGPADGAGYVLSGHTDVVPVTGQSWATDPFQLVVTDERAYGRGAADMKGFLACCLASAPAIAAAALAEPIHLAFSYDEEVGCIGVRDLLRTLADRGARPAGAFIGEPSSMQVVTGHKGGLRSAVTVRGKACHSSLAPRGVNAVEWGARLVAFIRDLEDRQVREGERDPLYDVPHTTLHVGVFSGGSAPNIVPHEAFFIYEVRAIGSEDPTTFVEEVERHAHDVLAPRMRETDPDSGFTFERGVGLPPLETDESAPVTTLAKRFAGRNDHAKVAYGTEAGLFTSIAGIPAVVVGPGDIEQAHKPDEWIALTELDRCNAFIARLLAHCSAA